MEIDDQETADNPNDSQTKGYGNQWPPWLKPLLEASFFTQCGTHTENECNLYCVDCYGLGGLCPDCIVPDHQDHKLIKVVRSGMNIPVIEAGDLGDIEERLDISGVLQRGGSIHLNKWPNPKIWPPMGATSTTPCCRVCGRYIHVSYQFCCLSCKVEGTPPPPPPVAEETGGAEVPRTGTSNTVEVEGIPPPPPPAAAEETIAAEVPRTGTSNTVKVGRNRRKGVPRRSPRA